MSANQKVALLAAPFRCRLAFALVAGSVSCAFLFLTCIAYWSPHSRFLIPAPDAQWIVYPVPPRSNLTSSRIEQHAFFDRVFELPQAVPFARLRLRSFGESNVTINDFPLALPDAIYVNQVRECDVAKLLHSGMNKIRVQVSNSSGPPALWLVIDGPEFSIETNDRWTVALDGAVELAAHPGERRLAVRPGNQALADFHTFAALQRSWPPLAVLAVSIAGLAGLGHSQMGRRFADFWARFRVTPLQAGLMVAVLMWIVLFNHNTFSVPQARMGFDVDYHLNYVQYILDRHALPLADEGWEMHHPPLFYLLTAGLLGFFRLSTFDPAALVILRLEGVALGLAQLLLVAACLSMVFPNQPRRQLFGLAIALFLPVHICVSHFFTNEALMTVLGTAVICLSLRIISTENPSTRQFLFLGLGMGAVLLTKATGVVIVGVALLVLTGRTIALPRIIRAPYLRGLGVAAAVTLLVSGWHYARVAARFGSPLVGNYDAASGNLWWQDPGVGTFTYLFSFGRALITPFYSGLTSLPDGIYATLWGDGLCGGVAFWKDRLPWNYDLMAAGYLLALAPSLMIVIGLFAALVQMVRQPRAEWFLLLGVVAGFAVATLYQFIRYPYSGHAKSIYLLTGMTSLCALGAWGGDLLARTGRTGSILAVALFGIWGCTAYASFWIQPESAATQNWIGASDAAKNRPVEALKRFRRAVEIDPHFNQARLNEAGLLAKAVPGPRERKLLDDVLIDDPENPEGLILMGLLLQAEGKDDEALDFLNNAGLLAPDNPLVQPIIGRILMKNGRTQEAILAFRQGLRISPASAPADHANLGILLAQEGQIEEAIAQYRQALQILPDYPYWQADLAWLLSTREDRRFHDPQEALPLAQTACSGAADDPACLEALAAAQAAAGEFAEAMKTAQRAIQLAAAGNQVKIVHRLEAAARQYQDGKEYHTNKPLHEKPYYPLMPPMIAG